MKETQSHKTARFNARCQEASIRMRNVQPAAQPARSIAEGTERDKPQLSCERTWNLKRDVHGVVDKRLDVHACNMMPSKYELYTQRQSHCKASAKESPGGTQNSKRVVHKAFGKVETYGWMRTRM